MQLHSYLDFLVYCKYIFFSLRCPQYHFLFSSLLYCKNTVYNTYNIQNMGSLFTLSARRPVNSKLLVVVLGESEVIHTALTVCGVGSPTPALFEDQQDSLTDLVNLITTFRHFNLFNSCTWGAFDSNLVKILT